jgi:gamma-glutamyltranspeptidase/glutathione hydrolase
MLLERFGTRPLGELLQPAIRCAADGFPCTSLLSQYIDEYRSVTRDPEWHRVYTPGGRAPALGEPFAQSDLARTLGDVASDGPDVMYGGRVGEAIAARLEAAGFVTRADLAAHTGEWGEPLATTYRGTTVYETPPPTQGLTTLMSLNLLEGVPLGRHRVHSVEHLHLLIEMTKLAYADRDRWIADPAAVGLPVAGLLDKAYAARRRAAFDPRKAQTYAFGDPEGDTTGFVVADRHGNIASVIESLFNVFGSGVVAPGTGVVLQNRGRHFELAPGHPNVLAPGKRPFHTLIAAIATRDDRPLFGFATMGGNGQAMFHTQVLTNLLDYGMDMQEAIERPRFLIGAFLPDDAADAIYVESRIGASVIRALTRKGHQIKVAPQLFVKEGHAHGIALAGGTWMGGADPRGDGVALGF